MSTYVEASWEGRPLSAEEAAALPAFSFSATS
jgi:hypothetical protein